MSTSGASSTGDANLSTSTSTSTSTTSAADSEGSEDGTSSSSSTGSDAPIDPWRVEHDGMSLDLVEMIGGRIYAVSDRSLTPTGYVRSTLAFSGEDGARIEPFGTDLIDPGAIRLLAAEDGIFISEHQPFLSRLPPRLARYSPETGEEELVITRTDDDGLLLDFAAWDGVLHTWIRTGDPPDRVATLHSYSAVDGSPVDGPDVATLTGVITARLAAVPAGLMFSTYRSSGSPSASIRVYEHISGDLLFNESVFWGYGGGSGGELFRPLISAGYPVAQIGSSRVFVGGGKPSPSIYGHTLEGFTQLSAAQADGPVLYFAGVSNSPGNPWRMEARETESWSLVEEFGTGGVLEGDTDPSVVAQIIGIFARGQSLYVVSREIDLTGDSSQTVIERRRLSDGSLD